MNNKPKLLLTGASGFIGKHFINCFIEDFIIIGLARRSRIEANIPYHRNLKWIQCDISNRKAIENAIDFLKNEGGVDYILHFAAYYDFSYDDHPAYNTINVEGTKNLLELSENICKKRFIFASSLAACKFPEKGEKVTEKDEPDADYHYARSKKQGEKMVRQYSEKFPCSVIRLAAVYSDWCEFAPLYKFLSLWLDNKIDSRILGGKGESAIPYIHVKDLCKLVTIILRKTEELPDFDVYNASPDGCTSHRELYELATRYYYGEAKKPLHIPKWIAYPGLILKNILKYIRITCEEPFERFWMIRYIDEKLDVDASYTREQLNWDITQRYHIKRRILFLLERMIRHKDEWTLKNEAALKRTAHRTNLMIYEKMIESKDDIINKIIEDIHSDDSEIFKRYKEMEENEFQCFMSTLYHLILASIRSNDRSLLLNYIDDIAIRKFAEGFEPATLCNTLKIFDHYILKVLAKRKDMQKFRQEIINNVTLSIQIAEDEIEDLYDQLTARMPVEELSESSMLPDCKELQRMIRQLSAVYQIFPEEKIKNNIEK